MPDQPRGVKCVRVAGVVQGALEGLAELGWIRPEVVWDRDGGQPTVRFRIHPRLPGRRE